MVSWFIKKVLVNNPNARVITNSGVGSKLDEVGISYTLLQGRSIENINGVLIEAFDCKHEEIFEEIGQVQNTGYFIAEKLFYPGDAFCNPEKAVDVLAMPVGGPWCKISDAIQYVLTVKPRVAFPVHDGMFQKDKIGGSHRVPGNVLPEKGIGFVAMNEGDEKEF